MAYKHKPTLIEKIAEGIGLIPKLHEDHGMDIPRITEPGELTSYPPPENGITGRNMNPKDGVKK